MPQKGQQIEISKTVHFPTYGFTLEPGRRGTYIGCALGLVNWARDMHHVDIEGITGYAIWLQADEFVVVPGEEVANVQAAL